MPHPTRRVEPVDRDSDPFPISYTAGDRFGPQAEGPGGIPWVVYILLALLAGYAVELLVRWVGF